MVKRKHQRTDSSSIFAAVMNMAPSSRQATCPASVATWRNGQKVSDACILPGISWCRLLCHDGGCAVLCLSMNIRVPVGPGPVHLGCPPVSGARLPWVRACLGCLPVRLCVVRGARVWCACVRCVCGECVWCVRPSWVPSGLAPAMGGRRPRVPACPPVWRVVCVVCACAVCVCGVRGAWCVVCVCVCLPRLGCPPAASLGCLPVRLCVVSGVWCVWCVFVWCARVVCVRLSWVPACLGVPAGVVRFFSLT